MKVSVTQSRWNLIQMIFHAKDESVSDAITLKFDSNDLSRQRWKCQRCNHNEIWFKWSFTPKMKVSATQSHWNLIRMIFYAKNESVSDAITLKFDSNDLLRQRWKCQRRNHIEIWFEWSFTPKMKVSVTQSRWNLIRMIFLAKDERVSDAITLKFDAS